MNKLPGPDLGEFLREQRRNAKLSLRQLSELAGVSNPYLSQIERGLKRPSAEILQQLAHGLQVSAETLYIQAGILEEAPVRTTDGSTVLDAIAHDPALTDRQRAVLVDIYESFVGPLRAAEAAEADAHTGSSGEQTQTIPTTETSSTPKEK